MGISWKVIHVIFFKFYTKPCSIKLSAIERIASSAERGLQLSTRLIFSSESLKSQFRSSTTRPTFLSNNAIRRTKNGGIGLCGFYIRALHNLCAGYRRSL